MRKPLRINTPAIIFLLVTLAVCVVVTGYFLNENYGVKKYTSQGFPGPEISKIALLPVDINTASVSELTSVEGITRKMAENIVIYRGAKPFIFPEDIMDVPGITEKDYELIKNAITVK